VEECIEAAGEFASEVAMPALDDVVDRAVRHGATVIGDSRFGLWQGGVVSDVEDRVRAAVAATGGDWREVACDPDLADTAAFCERYGFSPADSANTIVVASKGDDPVLAACVVLATHRLDVNGVVRRRLGARKVSFAPAELTAEVTGMVMGGVTPFGLPDGLAVWVDAAVFERAEIIVGGGSRSMKLVLPPSTLASLDSVEVVEGLARPIPSE
jgi:prolyl-tRNA editing enzyme YbaK/EbsC (Cys-tRNA(Pro) deacylase)